MIDALLYIIVTLALGALAGLIPYVNKPEMGKLGLVCCALSGVLFLQVLTAIGFVIALLVKKDDYQRRGSYSYTAQRTSFSRPTTPVEYSRPVGYGIICIAGPLKGRTYNVGGEGVLVGLTPQCTVRFPEGTPGVSHRHCLVRDIVRNDYSSGLTLTDLGSSYGTFLSDGRQLPQNFPMELQDGSRFYLASTACMFQVVRRDA